MKLAQIDRYIRQVADRKRRKALARDYDLVPAFLKQERPAAGLKGFTYSRADMHDMKTEKTLKESLCRFSRFMPCHEMEELVSDLASRWSVHLWSTGECLVHRVFLEEKALKERIEQLQQYRKNGVTTLKGKPVNLRFHLLH